MKFNRYVSTPKFFICFCKRVCLCLFYFHKDIFDIIFTEIEYINKLEITKPDSNNHSKKTIVIQGFSFLVVLIANS